jgi:four helix bundle protein
MNSFEELEVWKQSRGFRVEISKLAKTFPSDERYKLVDQIIRSSRSITANIAEGFGRFHHQENIQYCRQARGSLHETLDHLTCAFDEKYISTDQLENLRNKFEKILKLLNGYISYLKKAKSSQ